jgi:primase-polymerase (primpol)-like protein
MIATGLAALKQYPQFIAYRTELDTTSGKLKKIPTVSVTDQSKWMSYDAAQQLAATHPSQFGMGFVLHPELSRIAVVDVDGCRDPQTGKLSDLALDMIAMLPGAYVEVSISGAGIHIWFSYSGDMPAHACRSNGSEFYHRDRFFALGTPYTGDGHPEGFINGTVKMDLTVMLPWLVAQYFPPDTARTETAWSDGPREDWSGPADDTELLRRALNSLSTAQAFQKKASFADLWLANEQALTTSYPDPNGRPYDASAADAALAQHLAFWTGCDCERIERMMQKSALKRDKWEREDYLPRTILGAVSRQDRVYGDDKLASVEASKRRQEQIAENLKIGKGSEDHPTSSVLTEGEMLERYVYIIEGKRVLDLEYPRRIFALDEWKSAHKSSRTNGEETAKLWERNPNRKQVDTVTFRPGFEQVTEDPEGKIAANTWRPIERTATPGDASLFVHHIDYLFGADVSRFLDFLAHIEQRPGELPHTGWVHISPQQGTGRNWLSSVLCRVWSGYVAASFDLSGTLRTGFNGLLSQKQLAIVDEINEGGNDARWENAETLKSLITSEHRHINPKYGHQRLEYNACRWLIFSNHTSALPLTERDRRFEIVRNDNPPMPAEYYAQLYAAVKDPGFIAGVAELLRTRNISAFNPGAHALMNEAKREMVAASRSDADDVIAHLVANHPADVIVNSSLGGILNNQIVGRVTPHQKHALERAGVRPYGKSIRVGSAVSKVSILRNHTIWKEAATWQIQAELAKGSSGGPPLAEWPPQAVN